MSFWDDIGDALDFEKFQLGEWWDMIKEDPERLLFPSADPLSADISGSIMGKDYEPMVNTWGGPTGATFEAAEAEGIDTGMAQDIHEVAEGIAKAYTLNWGMDKLGAQFETGEGESKFDADTIQKGFQSFANSMAQQQAEQDKPMEVPPPMEQGQPVPSLPQEAPGMAVAAPGTALIPEPSLPPERVKEETFPRRA